MNITGPPSPASFAGSDWGSGPRGTPPLKGGPPGPNAYPGGGGGGRANLPTPPVSGSSHGSMMNGSPQHGGPMPGPPYGGMGGPPPRGDSRGPMPPGHPSPPQSLGRLSTSSNLSMRDPEAARRRNMAMEETLRSHYQVLRSYLHADLANRDESRSKKARDKLLRLSPIQFHELSTDIYDELRRRQNQFRAPPNAPNFLIPKENFHPKRNQARQKLSTLPETRFRDLATDVFFELERRFPVFTGRPPPNGMGPPSRTGSAMGFRGHQPRQDSLASAIMSPDGYGARPTQGNTIVPNKSYLVEDDDEGDMESFYGGKRDTSATNRSFGGGGKIVAEYQAKIEDLESKVAAMEMQLKEKDDELDNHKSEAMAGEDAEELRKSLEDKLSSAQALNRSLQDEIDSVRLDHDRSREQLSEVQQQHANIMIVRTQHDELLADHSDLKEEHETLQRQNQSLQRQLQETSAGGEWRDRCEDLESENLSLRNSVQEQQRLTKEVKAETAGFLAEMRGMFDENNESHKREEQLMKRNTQLESELQEWKDRYAQSQAQARSAGAASVGLASQQPTVGANMKSANGLIRDVDVTRFQLSVDDVLRTARSAETHLVLEKVKDVVGAVRPIVRSAAGATDPKAVKAHRKVTATTNNFITAGRNFAQSGGVSPVSLLDAAASHLSSALVELISIVKMRSGEAGEVEQGLPATTYQQPAPLEISTTPAAQAPTPAPAANRTPQLLQPSQYQQPQSQHSQQYQHYGDDDDEEDDEDDEDDDPTAGYYGDTPTSNTPVNGTSAEPLGELLPSTTYQLPSTTYQPQQAPARKPVGSAPKPQTNGYASEVDLTELHHFLDDQTSILIASIQSLVTSIRGNAPAAQVHSRLATIIATSGSILQRSSDAVGSSSNAALKTNASPLVSTLEQSFSKLQSKESEGQGISEGTPEWKKWCQGVPPVAFETAKVVKEMQKIVKDFSGRADDDDFS